MADTHPALFPLTLHPTTRDVARLVHDGGADALSEAQRRADDARYQEVRCRSALNPVKGMPFRWTLNPYRGCTHACHYCFARRYHEQFELGRRRPVRVRDPGEDQLARRAPPRAGTSRPGPASWWRSAPPPIRTSRSKATTSSRGSRSRRSARGDAGRPGYEGPDGRARRRPAGRRRRGVGLHGLHQRSHGGRGRVAPPRAGHRLRCSACRPCEPARCRCSRGCADGAGRARHHDAPGSRGDDPRRCRPRRAFVGANVLYLQGGTRDHFMEFLAAIPGARTAAYDELYAGGSSTRRGEYATRCRGMVRALSARRYGMHGVRANAPPRQTTRIDAPPAELRGASSGDDSIRLPLGRGGESP